MPILEFNVSWMLFNVMLALVAVLLGYFTLRANNIVFRLLFGFLWLLFLPNTIYLFTDLQHVIFQWFKVLLWQQGVLVLQYTLLQIAGVLTFILSFRPFERFADSYLAKRHHLPAIIVFNFLIAFGMVLGRVERINSWDVFFRPAAVIQSAIHVSTSLELLGLTFLFGLLCNIVYFLFRDWVMKQAQKFGKQVS